MKKKLPEMTKEYSLKDIFNADETVFSITFIKNSSYLVKGEKCNADNSQKCVLLRAYADGSEKIESPVIGKSKNPRCIKHIKSFNTEYARNKNHG